MATSFRFAAPGKSTRRWLAGGTAAALLLLGVPLGLPAANAAPGVTQPDKFEIDGNFAVDTTGNIDWTSVTSSPDFFSTYDPADSPANTLQTWTTPDATVYSTSSKENDPVSTWSLGSPGTAPDKTDIGGIWTWKKITDSNSWTYIAWDRAKGVGTDVFYFEFNKLKSPDAGFPVRSIDDVRLTVTDQGNGTLTLAAADKWDGNGWVDAQASFKDSFYGASNNGGDVLVPPGFESPNFEYNKKKQLVAPKDQFYEVAFDLSKMGLVPACPNPGFGVINFRDATGENPENLKDFTQPLEINIPSTCAALRINKVDGNDQPLTGATFKISPDPTVKDAASGTFKLVTDNVTDDSTKLVDADPAGGKILVQGVQPRDGGYTITEYAAPSGYILDASSLNTPAVSKTTSDPVTFKNRLGSVAWTKLAVPAGDFSGTGTPLGGAEFEVKAVDGDATDSTWNYDANPINVTDNSAPDKDPAVGALKLIDLPTGKYEVRETKAPAGYKLDTRVGTFTISNATQQVVSLTTSTGTESSFRDERLTGSAIVEKLGSATGTLSGVKDAVFTLWQVVGNPDPQTGGSSGLPLETNDIPFQTGITTLAPYGRATVTGLPWSNVYYFEETAAPAPYNLPDYPYTTTFEITAAVASAQAAGTSSPPVRSITDPVGTLVTKATDGALPNASIKDVATLGGIRKDAKGTITFTVYGPYAADSTAKCDANKATILPAVNVSGPGDYASPDFTPTSAGRYFWIASYSGHSATNTKAITGKCGDDGETSLVTPAKPGISTKAKATNPTGAVLPNLSGIYDTAQLYDVAPNADGKVTGTITFTVFQPGDTTCSVEGGTLVSTVDVSTLAVQTDKDGKKFVEATSATYDATTAGKYRWIASYSGDANNVKVSGKCNDANEDIDVAKAPTTIKTTATAKATLPNAVISDSATVTGLTSDATGDVTFKLYSAITGTYPNAVCSAQVGSTITVPVDKTKISGGSLTVTSGNVTVQTAGTYYWIAEYTGDGNNESSAGKCGEPGEISVVEKAKPTIVTTATDGVIAAGGTEATITDTAVLSGLAANATGDVTFTVYGPYATQAEAEFCGEAPTSFSVVKSLSGSNTAGGSQQVSATFAVPSSGYYAWYAKYAGDPNNAGIDHKCGQQTGMDEISYVPPRQPSISTVAVNPVNLPLTATEVGISDQATLKGLTGDATGDVIFSVYGPSDEAVCTEGTFKGSVTVKVDGQVATSGEAAGTAVLNSGDIKVSQAGTYWWVASYVGDPDNKAIAGECGEKTEMTLVTRAIPSIDKIAKVGDTVISGTVGETELVGRVDLGTAITFVVTVGNTGDAPATGPVVDTLPVGLGEPSDITPDSKGDAATVTKLPGGNYQITWNSITVAPNEPIQLTYKAVVLRSEANPDVPVNATLTNTATWLTLKDSTTTLVKYLTVTAEPFCDANTPKVTYTVTPFNLDPSIENWTTDLTFLTPQGATIDPSLTTINGQPQSLVDQQLTGTLLYPGTKVVNGVTVDWPGWKNTGTDAAPVWVVDGDGLTPAVKLQATVNPTGTSVVIYPAAAAPCAPPGVPSFTKTSPTAVGSTDRPSGNVVTGEKVHYVLTLTNNGGQSVTAPLTDTLPDGVTNPTAFTVSPSAGFTATPTVTGQKLDWGNVTVAAGQTVKYEFDVTVSAQPDPGQIVDLVNNAAWGALPGQTRHIVAGPGVEIVPTLTKTADPKTGSVVKVGDVITYTVKVGNNGNVALTGDLVDTLPKGIEVVGNYTRDDGGKAEPDTATATTLTWNDVTVQPGQVVTFTYEIKVLDSAQDQDSLVNTAEWLGLKASTEHTVSVPPLAVTGGGSDPLTTVGWAGALLVLGLVFLLWGRRRDEQG